MDKLKVLKLKKECVLHVMCIITRVKVATFLNRCKYTCIFLLTYISLCVRKSQSINTAR